MPRAPHNENPAHMRSQGGRTPKRNATNDKNVTKSLLFFQFQFLSASSRTTVGYTRTTVIKSNTDDQEDRAHSIQFCQPIEMYHPGEIKGFRPKSCYLRPSSSLFCERNAITRAGFIKWHRARAPRFDVKTFF